MINFGTILKIENQTNKTIVKIKNKYADYKAVYLPNIIPDCRAKYVFIAMEPSFRWARGDESFAKKQIANGFKNFIYSAEDFCLHYAITKFLGNSYYITDISKAAMSTKNANKIRDEIYPDCIGLLKEEIREIGKHKCSVYFIGAKVEEWLLGEIDGRRILHYSSNACKKRNEKPKEFPKEYKEFSETLTEVEFLDFISWRLKSFRLDRNITGEIYRKFIQRANNRANSVLTDSRKKLIFTYYKEFQK